MQLPHLNASMACLVIKVSQAPNQPPEGFPMILKAYEGRNVLEPFAFLKKWF